MRTFRSKNSWRLLTEPLTAGGCFETCRVKKGKVLHLKEHLERLQESCKTLNVPADYESQITLGLQKAAQSVRDGFVRVALQEEGHRPIFYEHPGLPYTRKDFEQGIALTTVATRRPWPMALPAQAKVSGRLDGILARAEGNGSLEVLRLGPHGYLTEGTVSNLFLVKDGILITPALWLGVLEGIMRRAVFKAARNLKIPVREIPVTRHELFNAKEAFLTNVLMCVLPIAQVDGRRIGSRIPGPITQRLARILEAG